MMKRDPFKGRKPGTVPDNRIAIVDHEGNIRGHVGRTATQAVVARIVGRHGSTLGQHAGKKAWKVPAPPPPKPPRPQMPSSAPNAAQGASKGGHTLEISLKQDKGSVKKPSEK